jgi:hypothetical protein
MLKPAQGKRLALEGLMKKLVHFRSAADLQHNIDHTYRCLDPDAVGKVSWI